MATGLLCPTDFKTVNENKVRLVAAMVLVLAILYLLTGYVAIPAFLMIDFLLRSGKYRRYSWLGALAEKLVNIFSIKDKPIDQAPKRFAAKIGLVLTFLMLLASVFDFTIIAMAIACLLVVFAALESMAGFCAGCYVYTFYVRLFPPKPSV